MHFDLSDEQRAIREAARGLLQHRTPPERIHERDEAGEDNEALWRELGELGWAGIALPESLGGQGLGLVELCLLLEEQGVTLSPTPLLPSACAARLLLRGGSDGQREHWLPSLAAGTARGGIGRLTNNTSIVAGAAGADLATLAGVGTGLLLELDGSPLERFETIDQLRTYGETPALGEVLPEDVSRGVQEAAVCVSAELLGVARHCLERTVAYVTQRHQFGVPIGSFQAVGHKCAEMLYRVESIRAAVYYAAWAADAAPERLPEAASIAKYLASEGAVAVAGAAIQAHGGVGFTWEANLHWWFKRAQLDAQLLGGASFHRARIGELLARGAR